MVEFGNNNFNNQQYTSTNIPKINTPVPKQVITDAQVKKETPKQSKDTFGKQEGGNTKTAYSGSFTPLSDEQAQSLANAYAETVSLHGQIFGKKPGQANSASSSQLTALKKEFGTTAAAARNYYGNIHNVYDDADGFIYIAGQGMQPYSENGDKYPTKDQLQEIADKALEGFLMISSTGGAKDLLRAKQAKGKELTSEDKAQVAALLKEEIKNMNPQQVRYFQQVLGHEYTNLLPGLDTHDSAKKKIEESERILQGAFSDKVTANADLKNQMNDETLILFAAPNSLLTQEPNGEAALSKYRQIIGGTNLNNLTIEQIDDKAKALEKEFNMEYS